MLLITLFSILFFILSWRKLDWAVMFIVAALPSYLIRFKIVGVPFTLLEAMILIAFFVWLIKETNFLNVLRGKYGWKELKEAHKARKPYPFGLELILVLILSYIAVFAAGLTDEALGIWKAYFFEPALFFILVLNVFGRSDDKKISETPLHRGTTEKIVLSLAAGALAVSALAIYQKITGNLIDNPLWAAAETRRVVSFFGYPNAVGLYLGPIAMLLIGYLFLEITNLKLQITNKFQTQNKKSFGNWDLRFVWKLGFKIWNFKTIFISLTIVLSLLSIYFAKSIGAIVGLVIAGLVFGLFAGKKLRWATLIIAAVGIIGVMIIPSIRTKVMNKVLFQDLSGQIRMQQWRETWQMMTESPQRFIFGTGLSGYQKAIAPYHKEGIFFNSEHEPWEEFHRKTVFNEAYHNAHWQPVEIYMYPHNIILNFWTELGLAGAILFIWIILKYFYFEITNYKLQITNKFQISKFKYINLGLMGAMIVIIVHGLVDVPYFKNDLSVLFWLLLAMLCFINLKIEKKDSI